MDGGRLARLLSFAVSLASAACLAPSREGVRLVRVEAAMHGTAIPLGGDRILTARHVVGEAQTATLDGACYRLQKIDAGSGGDQNSDWIILRACGLEVPGARVDFDADLRAGEPVVVVGFGSPEGARPEPRCVAGVVVERPSTNLPRGNETYVRVESSAILRGMSGGALVAMRDGRPVVVRMVQRQARLLRGATVEGSYLVAVAPSSCR